MKRRPAIFVVIILMMAILNSSCEKQFDYSADVIKLKADVLELQKRTDSLTAALALININNTTLNRKIDSLKVQINTIVVQITQINIQITQNNGSLTNVNDLIAELNRQLALLTAQLNLLYSQLNLTPKPPIDKLTWTLAASGNCWRIVPNLDSTTLFLSRATDLLKSTNLGVSFVSAGATFPEIRLGLGTNSGGAFSNFNGGQLMISGMENGYYMSNNNGASFSSTGPTGFGCVGVAALALKDGSFIASMSGFQRGIYKSGGTNNQTWTKKYSELDPKDFSQNSNTIYSATSGTVGGIGVMLKSTNQGETWSEVLSYNSSIGNMFDVEVVKDSLFFISEKGNFYVSNVSTVNTNNLRYSFPAGATFYDCNYSENYQIFAAVTSNSGIYISNNNGLSWTRYTITGVTQYNRVAIIKNKIFVTTTSGLYVASL